MRNAAAVLFAAVFLFAHAATLPRTLEDEDSINFALGVESFDVAAHRPHPPGYPVYIAMAKASTAVTPFEDRDRRAAAGLAIWSVIAGALGFIVLNEFWLAAGLSRLLALFAATVGVTCPLYWFASSRPLTDIPGLVAALAVQVLLIRSWRAIRDPAATSPQIWLWAAAASGFVIGIRSQTMWINAPMAIWCVQALARRGRWREVAIGVAAAASGALVWAVPLIWDSGGFGRYLESLRFQGASDFSGVQMLWTRPSRELLSLSIERTFVDPWVSQRFAQLIVLAGVGGLVWLARRQRETLALMLATFLPYLVFHFLFQEAVTLRYALPIVVALAGCAVIGLGAIGPRVAALGTLAAMLAGVLYAQPRLEAYASTGWPVDRAMQDMIAARSAEREPPVIRTHHQVWHGIQRIFDWYRPVWDVSRQPFPGDREWLEIIRHWQSGATAPVWFLTDLTRNDVALFDPRSRQLGGRYENPAVVRALIGAETRLDGLNWWRLDQPFWMLGAGWSLTPEVAGMTRKDGLGPQVKPVEAFVRRTETPVRVVIGGRHLDPAGAPASVALQLDGRPLRTWTVPADRPWFVEWSDLPAGTSGGAGPYATISVAVTSAEPGRPAPWVGLEQFDAAPADRPIVAFAGGWHEMEHDPRLGNTWRWTSRRSVLTVRGGTSELKLTLAGEAPRRYFDRAPVVVVKAGAAEIARFTPFDDFTHEVTIPIAAVQAAQGEIVIETDLAYVPAERANTPDRRQLGLKLFRIEVSEPGRAATTRSGG